MDFDVRNLKIEKISSDGKGIARSEEGIVFVSGALPGEDVEAEIVQRRRDFSFGRVRRIISPNPGRAAPVCPVFGTCGGCQLQHASYELQLGIKAEIVLDAMTRTGGFSRADFGGLVCEPSPNQWGYRNKASFPVRKIKGKPTMGFFKEDSHFLVPIQSCPVNAAPLNEIFAILRDELPRLELDVYDEREHKGALRHVVMRAGLGQTLVSVVINGRLNAAKMKSISGLCRALKNVTALTLNHNSRPGNVILGDRTENIKGGGLISERLDEWTLRYDTSSFFQVNTAQAARLYRHAAELAGIDGGSKVLELYSGVGSLTCYLAKAKSLTAVEEWESAAGLMEENLNANGLSGVEIVKGKAEEFSWESGRYNIAVLDPPRSGCDRAVLERIAASGVGRVVYVSCNPATLARDAKILKESGYEIKSARAFDMFPQTAHVETVLSMERA